MKRRRDEWRLARPPLKSMTGSMNAGRCVNCGAEVTWRSLSNRCWRCEMERVRSRLPFYINREGYSWLSGIPE